MALVFSMDDGGAATSGSLPPTRVWVCTWSQKEGQGTILYYLCGTGQQLYTCVHVCVHKRAHRLQTVTIVFVYKHSNNTCTCGVSLAHVCVIMYMIHDLWLCLQSLTTGFVVSSPNRFCQCFFWRHFALLWPLGHGIPMPKASSTIPWCEWARSGCNIPSTTPSTIVIMASPLQQWQLTTVYEMRLIDDCASISSPRSLKSWQPCQRIHVSTHVMSTLWSGLELRY